MGVLGETANSLERETDKWVRRHGNCSKQANAGDCLVSASSKFFCFVLRGSLLEAPVPNGQEFNQDLNDETNFQDSPSHRILEHMYEALNVV